MQEPPSKRLKTFDASEEDISDGEYESAVAELKAESSKNKKGRNHA